MTPADASAAADAAAFYDAMWADCAALDERSPAARHRRRLVAARVTRLLEAHAPRVGAPRLLDAGMGPGHLLRALARELPQLSLAGADVSPRSLELARAAAVPGEHFVLDLEATDLAAVRPELCGAFDVVVCSEVLEHLHDDARAARNLGALLAPSGALIVTVPGGAMSRFDERIGHLRHYTPRTLGTLLAVADLRPGPVTAWGFPFHSAYRVLVRAASRAAFADPPRPANPASETSPANHSHAVVPRLAALYRVAGALLDPLFYLNAPFGGEQLLVVARRAG